MKRFLLLATLLPVLFLAGCSSSDPVEPQNQPIVNPPEAPFTIDVKDVTATMVTVEVTPLNAEAGYYMDVLSESNYLEAQRSGIDSYLIWMVGNLTESMEIELAEAIRMMTSYGNDGFYLTSLKPDSNYYALAVGIDEKGLSTTEVVAVPFRTLPAPQSENEIDVTITGPEEGRFTVDVTTTNEDPYVITSYPTTITGEISDEEIAAWVISNNMAWGAIEQITYVGDQTLYEGGKSGWEYEVIVFGYSAGMATTPAIRKRFAVPEGGDPQACSFAMNLEFKDFDMIATVAPSDHSVVYISDVMEEEYYQALLAKFSDPQQALAENLEAMISAYIAELGSRAKVVDMIATMGPLHYTMRYRAVTEYRQWCVPVDAQGNPTAPFSVGEKFMSPNEVRSDAALTLKGWTYYNGTDLYHLDPEKYKGFKGFAAVAIEVEPSDDAVEWWSYIALDDLTDRARAVIINNLLIAPTQKNLTSQLIACYWGTNTIMGVAKDAEGNYGPLLMEVIELSKEGAAEVPDGF